MIDSDEGDIKYLQLGIRMCYVCYTTDKVLINVTLDMEDTKALRREVRICHRCGVMAIGEHLPRSLNLFFDLNGEEGDTPNEERISV